MNIKNVTNFVVRNELINDYLAEINKVPTLTAQEEKELFARIDLSKNIVNNAKKNLEEKKISNIDYTAIVEREENTQREIRNEIIYRNQRFVFAVAKRYSNGELLTDLVNVGNLGMFEAFEKYDWTTGNRFCSFAVWFIRRSINAYLNKENLTVRTTNASRILPKVKKIENDFYLKNGRRPAASETMDILKNEYDIEVDSELDIYGLNVQSIDSQMCEDDDKVFENSSDFTDASASFNEYEDDIETEDLSYALSEALKSLTSRERTIFCMSAGYGYDKEFKDKEIADIIGLTSERVRQIRKATKDKLANAYCAAQSR